MRVRTGLLWAMGLMVVAFAGSLALPGEHGWDLIVDHGLGTVAMWVPAAACWVAVSRAGIGRRELLFAAAAVTSLAVGSTYAHAVEVMGGSLKFPSLADVGYLLFYPLMLAALVAAARHHVGALGPTVWLDGAVGSLGVASVLAVLLHPVLDSALAGPPSMSTLVALAYPASALLLVAALAGVAALRDVHMGAWWGLLVMGLLVFAATDAVYTQQMTTDAYAIDSPLDAGWAIGLALVALWVDGAAQHDGSQTQGARPRTGAMTLTVSVLATAAALGVLVMSAPMHLPTLAVVPAGMALVVAAARAQLAFRELARVADLRQVAATTDELTGLLNRRALHGEAHVRLIEPRHRRLALLLLDLNKFKEVNDSLGHHAGDLLLVQVGARLSEHLRPGDVLARLGGDEFAVLLQDSGRDEATAVAVKLWAVVAEPFALEGLALHSSVSVGISLFPDDGPDLSTLLRKADIAMYRAKVSGVGHHLYDRADDASDAARLRTVEELRTALAEDQFVVHYQPKIDLDTGEVHSVEALVRWDHPTRGLLYPDTFINLIDENGLMPALTRVVAAQAVDQAAAWAARGQQLRVAVNVSVRSLVDAHVPERIAAMLAAKGVPPSAMQMEITEDFLMADREQGRAILTRLRNSGIQISIDDFGTGYSSLSYLRDLPIDEVKLDRSFIFPMADDARAAALVASTISLAHSLGLRVVAEGVETSVAYNELKRLGCDQAQGYFMCRPVPAAELDRWLKTRPATGRDNDHPKQRPSTPWGRHWLPALRIEAPNLREEGTVIQIVWWLRCGTEASKARGDADAEASEHATT